MPLAAFAQASSVQPTTKRTPAVAAQAPAPVREEIAQTRRQLFEMLQSTPRLLEILRNDGALLADQTLVARHNPQLAEFLEQHPDVKSNPEFYLSSQVGGLSLDKLSPRSVTERERILNYLVAEGGPFIIFLVVLIAGLWFLSMLQENLRWNRVFRTQTEIYNKLLDKFNSNEEFLAYVRSETGKRFLEFATLPQPTEGWQKLGIARFLFPLQAGVVLSTLGVGFYFLRQSLGDAAGIFYVIGVLALSLGVGFIIAAILAFGIARRFGLVSGSETPEPVQLKRDASSL